MICRSRLSSANFIIKGLSLSSHVATLIVRENTSLFVLQAVCTRKERGVGSCGICWCQHLLPEVIPCFLNCFFICGAESEHKVRRLLRSSALIWLLALLWGKLASSTIFWGYQLCMLCLLSFLLLFLREEEILGAACTSHNRFIIVINGLIYHLILLMLIVFVKVIASGVSNSSSRGGGCCRGTFFLKLFS